MQSSSGVCVFLTPEPTVYEYPKVQALFLKQVEAKSPLKVIKQTKQAI